MRLKAQSTLEYAMVVACVAAALLAMQFYLKRGIQGKLRQAGDEIGEQYAPGNADSSITTTTDSEMIINQSLVQLNDSKDNPINGIESKVEIDHDTTTKKGHENLGAFENGLF